MRKTGKYQKFVYFECFDEFFSQFHFFPVKSKFVYFQRFDEFFPSTNFSSQIKFAHFQRFDEFFRCFSISGKNAWMSRSPRFPKSVKWKVNYYIFSRSICFTLVLQNIFHWLQIHLFIKHSFTQKCIDTFFFLLLFGHF